MPGHPLLGTPLYLIRHFCSPLHSAHPLRDVGTSRKVRVPAKLRCHLVGNTTLLEKVSMYFLSSSRHSKSISVLSFVIGVIIKILGLNCCRKRRRFWPPCPAPPPVPTPMHPLLLSLTPAARIGIGLWSTGRELLTDIHNRKNVSLPTSSDNMVKLHFTKTPLNVRWD